MTLRKQETNIKLIFELSLAQPSPILCNGKDKHCVKPRFNSVLISISLQTYGLARITVNGKRYIAGKVLIKTGLLIDCFKTIEYFLF